MSEFEGWLRELESERPAHPRQVAVMRAHDERARLFWVSEFEPENTEAWRRAVREREARRRVDPVVEAAIRAYAERKRDALRGGKAG